jgi:DNA-binding MarR family transcriptional regulator
MVTKEKSQLGKSIVLTGRLLINSVNSHFVSLGTNITLEQLDVLMHIATNSEKKIIQNELAVIMHKNKSAILRTVDILEKKKFVQRISVEGDRRKNIIEATSEGISIAKKAIEIFQKIEKAYMKKIGQEDLAICARVLEIVKEECQSNKIQQVKENPCTDSG